MIQIVDTGYTRIHYWFCQKNFDLDTETFDKCEIICCPNCGISRPVSELSHKKVTVEREDYR